MKNKTDKELEYLRGLEKLKASPVKSANYSTPLNDDVMKVKNLDVSTPETPDNFKRTISGATQKIDTNGSMPILSGNAFTDKINKLRSTKIGQKLMGAIPLAGAGFAALQGDPAMAAEQAAYDLTGPVGAMAETLKPDVAGNPEEERMMLNERDALEDYANSPAAKDAKFAKIKASLGLK